MKTVIIVLQLCLFLCYIAASNAHRKKRHNKVYFTGDAHSISFKMTSHCITPKQPFDNPVWLKTVKKSTGLDIMAGRHGSSSKKYFDTIDCTYKTMAHSSSSFFVTSFTYKKIPFALNFSVEGTLFVDGVEFDQIVLAQGHHGAVNNWWFGGNFCSAADSIVNAVNCFSINHDHQWCFIHGRSDKLGFSHTSPHKIKVLKHACSYYYTID